MSRRALPMLGPVPPAKPAEADDPLALVGVPVPVDEDTFDEMARCFMEELVRDGWSDARLMTAFRSPFYAGLHVIWLRRGEGWVKAEIADVRVRWHRPDTATAAVARGRGVA